MKTALALADDYERLSNGQVYLFEYVEEWLGRYHYRVTDEYGDYNVEMFIPAGVKGWRTDLEEFLYREYDMGPSWFWNEDVGSFAHLDNPKVNDRFYYKEDQR